MSSTAERLQRLQKLNERPDLIKYELAMCAQSCEYFVREYVMTFDPRLIAKGQVATIPLDMWAQQAEMLRFFDRCLGNMEAGLVEKSRDYGFTWLAMSWAIHKWLFRPGFTTRFGSRKLELVDEIGNPDSIFEKGRVLLRWLPWWLMPAGFSFSRHAQFCLFINPQNGASIAGEGGDQMGRGGRSTVYFLDEYAFQQHAEVVDAATSGTSDVRIFGSTVNGPGNLFFRKRHALRPDQVFVCDYRHDPRKTPEWVAKKKAELEPHVWASEYERDYGASIEGICIPAPWVQSCQRIADLIPIAPSARGIGGFDVGAGGKSKSVAVARFGAFVTIPQAWGNPDTTETAFAGMEYMQSIELPNERRPDLPCRVTVMNFDSVGVGHNIGRTLARGRKGIVTNGVNTGVPASEETTWDDGFTSAEKFGNLKAELWWLCRERARKTHLMARWIETGGKEGEHFPPGELLSLPPNSAGPDAVAMAFQLSLPKAARNEAGKIVIEKKEQLAKRQIPSPDHAEALILTFQEDSVIEDWIGAYGRTRRR